MSGAVVDGVRVVGQWFMWSSSRGRFVEDGRPVELEAKVTPKLLMVRFPSGNYVKRCRRFDGHGAENNRWIEYYGTDVRMKVVLSVVE